MISFSAAIAIALPAVHCSPMQAKDVIPTYERVGQIWAKERNRSLMEKQWLDRFLTAAPRGSGAVRVLDLGCGSGQPMAAYMAERGATLTGVDATETMTRLYTQTLPQAEVIKADMRTLDLARDFDAILAWASFFHLSADDQRAMFARFAAHSTARTTLMFTSGHIAGEAIGQVANAPIYHASLDPAEYQQLLEDNGFKVLRYTPEDPSCGGHTVWLAQYTGT
ncbi:methyltransferase family protein [Yoonia maricola]|uniref:Methyltransferase family protein n=1 Tax=Yoonia maricola TaxID=420999 RepID=A0A2M8WKU0_9RHOB|nr:class I SAM-dependent methyltransferase [Yoonia maricola]PJI91544.1 methyltransferase family protein [Yoonia maricola]